MEPSRNDHSPIPGPSQSSQTVGGQTGQQDTVMHTEVQDDVAQHNMNGDSIVPVLSQNSSPAPQEMVVETLPPPSSSPVLHQESALTEGEISGEIGHAVPPTIEEDISMREVSSEPHGGSSSLLEVPKTEAGSIVPEEASLQAGQGSMKVDEDLPNASQSSEPVYQVKFIMSGHTRSVSSLKFSPDGTMLASAAADKLVKIWDCEKGELLDTFVGHTEGISDIAWSSDCEFLASASDDKTIRIWSMETGETVKILRGHTNFVFCVNFNPKCNLLVSGGFDETVRVWDVARAKPMKTLPAHSDPVTAVTFNHDGTLIASCAMDGLIRVWDTDSGQCLKTLADDDNPICSHIKFSPNSKYILASTQDSTIRLWNIQSSRCVKTYIGHTNRTYSVFCDFTHDGQYVVSGSEDSKVFLWHLQNRQIVQMLEGHRDAVIAVAANPKRPMIASASVEKDLTIHVWTDNRV